MNPTNQPMRVTAVGEPGATQQQIITSLSSSSQTEFELADFIEPSDYLIRDVRNSKPQIVITDYQLGDESLLDVIDDIGDNLPGVAIIAIIPANDPLIAQQVMLAGARAFLIHPFTQVNLLSTLRRVRDLSRRQMPGDLQPSARVGERSRPVKTVAVFSPRGGTGCSTIAVNLAISIYEQTDQRILLMGGKLYFGHLGLMLNIRTNNTLADLIPHATHMEEALVDEVVVRHPSGIHVLMDPFDFQIAQGIRPQELFNVIQGLQRMFDMIIIDAGSALTENAVTIMDMADRIILVTNPDLASLHDTTRFIQLSRSLAYSQDKIMFVLNRSDMKGGVRTNDIESVVNRDIHLRIPDGGPKVIRSLNRGIPLVLRYPRNPASRAIQGLAKDVSQIEGSQVSALPQDGFAD